MSDIPDYMKDDAKKLARLKELAEEVQPGSGSMDGSVAIVRMSRMLIQSDKAKEFGEILPWLLTKSQLWSRSPDVESILTPALKNPALHAAVLPCLPTVMERFVKEGLGTYFYIPAKVIAESGNDALQAAIKPYMPEAIMRHTWMAHKFSRLAGMHLDMGGDVKDLVEPLQALMATQTDDPKGAFRAENREVKLGKLLCTPAFIEFINRPDVSSAKELHSSLGQFVGGMLYESRGKDLDSSTCVLVAVQGKKTGIFWLRHETDSSEERFPSHIGVNTLSKMSGSFMDASSCADVAQVALTLFSRMEKNPDRGIATGARDAVRKITNEFATSQWRASKSLPEAVLVTGPTYDLLPQ